MIRCGLDQVGPAMLLRTPLAFGSKEECVARNLPRTFPTTLYQVPEAADVAHRLINCDFLGNYDSYEQNPTEDFLIPALSASIQYDRGVGYFSSALMTVLAEAFSDFAERGGQLRLICSPILSFIDAGTFENLGALSLLADFNAAVDQMEGDGLAEPPLSLMAALIQRGNLQVKFAMPFDRASGMFHQKFGIFTDSEGQRVGFVGSNNESVMGWLDLKNSESFDVDCSWRGEEFEHRIAEKQHKFERMWRNQYPGFEIRDFSRSLDFIERRTDVDIDLAELKGDVRQWYEDRKPRRHSTDGESQLRPYQREAIANWVAGDRRGVVCFATGAGKTWTAIAALEEWLRGFEKRSAIILVPTARLQKQWLEELKGNPGTRDYRYLLVGGDSAGTSWNMALRDATEYRRHNADGIVIAIGGSARKDSFVSRVAWGRHLLVIADEVHNFGAPGYANLLDSMNVGATLGLSATPERYNDDENVRIRDLFGPDLMPVVDIPYAQNLGVLVPYRYRFDTVTLRPTEIDRYRLLTRRILVARSLEEPSGHSDNEQVQILRAQRANILKSAANKVRVAAELLQREYRPGSSWIVFCNDESQLGELQQAIGSLHPLAYFGRMDADHDAAISYFESRGGLLLSIHMLDEGIDIPSIDHCLLLASSQSKRQFIQRRGRVLRVNKTKPKSHAEIWDLIVVGDDGMAFVDSEIDRAVEFAGMSMNQSIVYELESLQQRVTT